MPIARVRRVFLATSLLGLVFSVVPAIPARAALPKVPEEFDVRLVATVPAVLYPCQLATAPDGSLFVAEDPMDQVGPYESKHGRILLFRDGKAPVVFADGFRAIFGMAWHEGSLYVCHMPFLTVLRDTNGDGKADERKDLFRDLGPTNNPGLNDHIVSGIQFGMDGYLYISTGDKGVPRATGPDGRTIQIIGGGTFRCRPDGTGLEVVSTGTRNHLDPNLDDRDNIFTYDNTDDGDGWWTRVTHHVDGGYFGYPYDYHNHKERMLDRMAEYGGGSPCGAVVYKEDAWPEKYRGLALWAEWGKGNVQAFRFAPDGATFKVGETFDFALPAGVDNFRPIDLAVSYDGRTLYVADWGMGSWGSKTEKVGRVFAITPKAKLKTRPRGLDTDGVEAQIKQLDHPSFNERMRAQRALIKKGKPALTAIDKSLSTPDTPALARRHLIWAIDGIEAGSRDEVRRLVPLTRSPVPDVRAQAARALGERRSAEALTPVAGLLKDPEPTVRLQAVIALGRMGKSQAVPALLPSLAESDRYIAFSARQALRRINDWKAAAAGLKSTDARVRAGVMAAMELVHEDDAVKALSTLIRDRAAPAGERAQALGYLVQAHRKTKPWNGRWWGTRPTQGKPPAREVEWSGTRLVLTTMREGLHDHDAPVRAAAVVGVRESKDRESLSLLHERFPREADNGVRIEAARTFAALDDSKALPLLITAFRDAKTAEPVRDASLKAIETIGTDLATKALVELVDERTLTAERQRRVIQSLGRFKARKAVPVLVRQLKSSTPEIRSEAAEALGSIGELDGVGQPLRTLLNDPAVAVRQSAIKALGVLKDREAIPALLSAADQSDTRFAATIALAAIPDAAALQVYLRGLGDKNADVRTASANAIGKIRDQAAPILDQLASRRELSPSLIPELKTIYSALKPVAGWRILGPFDPKATAPVSPTAVKIDFKATHPGLEHRSLTWKYIRDRERTGIVDLYKDCSTEANVAAYGYAEVRSDTDKSAQLVIGSDDNLTIWLNGTQVYDFQSDRGFEKEQDRVDVKLVKGTNRLLIRCGNHGGPWMYFVGVAAPTDYAFLKGPAAGGFNPDQYRELALKGQGKSDRGRTLFNDPQGLACVKCHRAAGTGGTVGPELSSVGAKYPRDELINSVLNPSARISSGYEPVVLALADGRVLTGIIKSETAEALEIEDADAKRIKIPKDDIEARKRSDVSLMPTGLAQGLTPTDFADLIAYLESLKEPVPPAAASPSGR